ncbi:hypothetical protein DIPPA_32924 [Diplonema papillatum]|nr:hypothetical protein DIPPA_32924 [Diplonema papillatum]
MQVCTKRQQLDGVCLIVKRTLNSCRSMPLDVHSISHSTVPCKLYDMVIYICSQDIVVTEEIIRSRTANARGTACRSARKGSSSTASSRRLASSSSAP